MSHLQPADPTPEDPPITPDAARDALIKDAQTRRETCAEALDAILNEHRCKLSPVVQIKDGQVHMLGVEVVPIP